METGPDPEEELRVLLDLAELLWVDLRLLENLLGEVDHLKGLPNFVKSRPYFGESLNSLADVQIGLIGLFIPPSLFDKIDSLPEHLVLLI